jgi:hypothetical protein
MSTRDVVNDPLRKPTLTDRTKLLDRVFYATGAMLDATDFTDEQAYHRGRLARALAYLHGAGTVAGLKVGIELTPEEMVVVQPGMALDRLGRIIEVPRPACIRVDEWFAGKGPSLNSLVDGGQILADVFIQFVECERGKTPAFARGAMDALDAVSPSRLRDGYRLDLLPRPASARFPENTWPDVFAALDPADRRAAMLEAVFEGWRETTDWWDEVRKRPRPLVEHDEEQETTAVFLARVTLGATAGSGTVPPSRTPGATVDNSRRPIVFTAGHWLGNAIR